MKLLHKKSILECNEIEYEEHCDEINRIYDAIGNIKNYKSIAISVRTDINNGEEIDQRELLLHDIDELLQGFDIKIGIDFYLNELSIRIHTFGQHYEKTDEHTGKITQGQVKNRISILVNENGDLINIAKELENILEMSNLEPLQSMS